MRAGGRKAGDLREIRVTPGVQMHAEGSVLFELGETKIVCSASVEERVNLVTFMKWASAPELARLDVGVILVTESANEVLCANPIGIESQTKTT